MKSKGQGMALVTLRDVSLAFGGPMLLEGADLQIEKGERICLIGRNGTGKSTLLKLIHGEHLPDRGTVTREPGLKTAMLPQDVPLDPAGSVYDVVASGHRENAALLGEYHRRSHALGEHDDPDGMARLNETQHALETAGAWHLHQQVRTVISRMGLDEPALFRELSAGLKRRVYLARALVSDPDLLLLDEPTNHLDIDAIVWMEAFLLRFAKTMLFVTHDRAFLRRLATRIVELDRATLFSFPGDYEGYLGHKEEMLENEAAQNARFDKRVTQEEAWARKGIRARRTRNEGRLRALMEMRARVERRALPERECAPAAAGGRKVGQAGPRCQGHRLCLRRGADHRGVFRHHHAGREGGDHRAQRLRARPPCFSSSWGRSSRPQGRCGRGFVWRWPILISSGPSWMKARPCSRTCPVAGTRSS